MRLSFLNTDVVLFFRLVHPKLSNLVADKLGVASLRRLLLAQSTDSMALGIESVQAFGQSEALTTRLKNILEDYPEGGMKPCFLFILHTQI